MGESADVKALRARFNSRAHSDTSSRDSGSPKSPRPGFGRPNLPVRENDLSHHRLSPALLLPPMASPGLVRFPNAEPVASSGPVFLPRPPPSPEFRPYTQPATTNRVKQTGEMLQSSLLKQQRLPLAKPAPALGQAQASAAPAPASIPPKLQQKPQQRGAGGVAPLRRSLPPEGPLPLKPKRPPNVNLETFQRYNRSSSLPYPRKRDGSPCSSGRKMSLPAVISPPKLPQRSIKPSRLPRQAASVDIEDDQETYDDIDIASLEISESRGDTSQRVDAVDEDVYESIDEGQVEASLANTEKKPEKETRRQQEREREDQMENQKKESWLRKNFQLQGGEEIHQTARVRHDWHGGELDLNVREGESVEIIRVRNNPTGKWLARSQRGNYGYISNTCVDVDYEAVKRKLLHSENIDTSWLPPPPPDPPLMLNVESPNRDSMLEDNDDYDDVQPLPEDFPPPPPEVSIDPKVVKELRKKFKFEGPIRVLQTMIVDPNSSVKKPGGKDLHVTQGEILDVIQLTSNKKALCRNQYGKFGYVSRSLLLQMEGDIYDDVEYTEDTYDNDLPDPGF